MPSQGAAGAKRCSCPSMLDCLFGCLWCTIHNTPTTSIDITRRYKLSLRLDVRLIIATAVNYTLSTRALEARAQAQLRIAPSFNCPLTGLGPLKQAQDLSDQAGTYTVTAALHPKTPSNAPALSCFTPLLLPRRSIAALRRPITAGIKSCNAQRTCALPETRQDLARPPPTLHYDELAGVLATHAGQRKSLRIHCLFHASPVSGSLLATRCTALRINSTVVPFSFTATHTQHHYHVPTTV